MHLRRAFETAATRRCLTLQWGSHRKQLTESTGESVFKMEGDSNSSKGRCSRCPDCKAPLAHLGKYSCVYCKAGLHTAVFGCSEIVDDNVVQCVEGFGCRKRSHFGNK